ncbi:MAG: hypothetical protein EON89_06970 [Brevundimonas sp.]|nr:MAG: hypothetical protein EON89_06970 [Brevundimonas sp.]
MIVWSGWGFLVAIFFVVAFMIGVPVGVMVSPDTNIGMGVAAVVAGLLTGLASFLLARQIERGQGRAFIDEATQQRIVVRPSAGSLFFIPTRYWAYVAPVVGIAFGALVMTTPPVDPAAAEAVEPAVVETAPRSAAAPVIAQPAATAPAQQPT